MAPRVSGEEPLPLAESKDRPTDPVEVLDSPRAGTTVIRGNALRLAGYAAGVGLSVVSASLMIRHLGPTDWGAYVTVSSLIALVAGLVSSVSRTSACVSTRRWATTSGSG